MSTLTRSAKPAKSWTANDLLAFNIQVISEDLQTFFGAASLPAPDVLPMIWDRIDYSPAPGHRDPPAARFFARLSGVAERSDEVSAVKDFTLSLYWTHLGTTTSTHSFALAQRYRSLCAVRMSVPSRISL